MYHDTADVLANALKVSRVPWYKHHGSQGQEDALLAQELKKY